MSPPSAQERRVSDSPSLTPIPVIPPVQETNPPDPPDPNMANPRLIFNRALIYERRLPGDAYITAHVQRLQHGYYSSEIVSDKGAKHVDFLAIAFTFHSPHTITHRIKSATIKVSVHGSRELPSSKRYPYGTPPGNPHFFMHAPHLLYGTVSPETMEWTFSLAGSLGISEMPVSASVIPSGSVNSRYKRYEMMRVQGSARTLKSATDPKYNVEAGQIVWSMEENNVQQSGLPREFTFVMLVQKPSARSRVTLSIDVDPVIDAMLGSYPALMLKLPEYLPLSHRGVDFQQEVGQRFEPVDPVRGFNFANLGSMFDEYIAMPGRKYSRQMQIPADNGTTENHFQVPFPGQFGPFNPNPYQQQLQTNNLALQNNGLSLQNNLLQTTLQSLGTGHREDDPQPRAEPRAYHGPSNTAMADQPPTAITVNVHHLLDPTMVSQFTNLARASPGNIHSGPRSTPSLRRSRAQDLSSPRMPSDASTGSKPGPTASSPQTRAGGLPEVAEHDDPEKRGLPRSPEMLLHASETRRVARDGRDGSPASPKTQTGSSGHYTTASSRRVMSLINSPLSASLISALAER